MTHTVRGQWKSPYAATQLKSKSKSTEIFQFRWPAGHVAKPKKRGRWRYNPHCL